MQNLYVYFFVIYSCVTDLSCSIWGRTGGTTFQQLFFSNSVFFVRFCPYKLNKTANPLKEQTSFCANNCNTWFIWLYFLCFYLIFSLLLFFACRSCRSKWQAVVHVATRRRRCSPVWSHALRTSKHHSQKYLKIGRCVSNSEMPINYSTLSVYFEV